MVNTLQSQLSSGVARQPRYAVTELSAPSQTDFNKSRASYTGLLVHYMVKNERPKYHLCVNVLSKIVEREGADTAIAIAETLQNSISAESYRITKNALLAALVLQKQTAAAAAHLRRLLQQSGHWQLDAAVVADLLQLCMAADSDRDTTTLRREYKKRALEASQLYSEVMGHVQSVHTQSQGQVQLQGSNSNGNSNSLSQDQWRGQEQERGYPSWALPSVSASAAGIDRIHEYGARAFAVSREWSRAVAAVSSIGERHLASDALSLFSSKMLDRIVKSVSKSPEVTASYGALALKLSLLQPLHLLPSNSPLLSECLLQLSSHPEHFHTVAQCLEDIRARREGVAVAGDRLGQSAPNTDSLSDSLSSGSASQMLQRLFLSGCSTDQIVEVIGLLWGQANGDYGYSSSDDRSSSSCSADSSDSAHPVSKGTDTAPVSPAMSVITRIIDIAVIIREDGKGDLSDLFGDSGRLSPRVLEKVLEGVEALPAMVHRALSCPAISSPTPSGPSQPTDSTPHSLSGALRPSVLPGISLPALNPSLRVLVLSFKGAALRDMASSTLRAIADYLPESEGNENDMKGGQNEDNVDYLEPLWRPDTDLLSEVLCIDSSAVGGVGAADPLALYREVTVRVRAGVVPDAYILASLLR